MRSHKKHVFLMSRRMTHSTLTLAMASLVCIRLLQGLPQRAAGGCTYPNLCAWIIARASAGSRGRSAMALPKAVMWPSRSRASRTYSCLSASAREAWQAQVKPQGQLTDQQNTRHGAQASWNSWALALGDLHLQGISWPIHHAGTGGAAGCSTPLPTAPTTETINCQQLAHALTTAMAATHGDPSALQSNKHGATS